MQTDNPFDRLFRMFDCPLTDDERHREIAERAENLRTILMKIDITPYINGFDFGKQAAD